MAGFLHTIQRPPIVMAAVSETVAGTNATLVGTANLTQAYRLATLTDRFVELKDYTNGLYVSLKTTIDGDTGTFELWGYPISGGAAQFFGAFTWITDEAVDDAGLFYVDEFVLSVAGQHTVTILNFPDGIAVLKFDTLGLTFFVAHITAMSSTATPGYATVEMRPW